MLEKQNIESLLELYSEQKNINTDKAWEQVRKRIVATQRKQYILNLTRNAAAILLPFVLIFHFIVSPMINENKLKGQTLTITSAAGVVTQAILPDGSQVWLNSQSTLTYPQKFSKKHRTVTLSGEAFFDVTSDKKNRFNVITPQKDIISAYGTEFNVNSYSYSKNSKVTLVEGNVEISVVQSNQKINLGVNEKATINNASGNTLVNPTDTYVDIAWKDGKMVFRRAKLDQIVERLSQKFGVDFILDDEKLKEYEYTATFVDETLEDILDLLQRSAPISYTIHKQQQRNNNTFTHKEIVIKINN